MAFFHLVQRFHLILLLDLSRKPCLFGKEVGATLTRPPNDAAPGTCRVAANKDGLISNAVPFVLDSLAECVEKEPNNEPSQAQKVEAPIIANGRIDQADDWDVFRIEGRAGEKLVAEVHARRLGSPLDSMLKVTDESGHLPVIYKGLRPDMFQDGAQAVVEGRYTEMGTFEAHNLVLKCPSKYEEAATATAQPG